MTSRRQVTASSVARLSILAVLLHLVTGVTAVSAWLMTGNIGWVNLYFSYQGALFLVWLTLMEMVLSIEAWRQFEPGEPLRLAWLLISVAAMADATGAILTHILGRFGTGETAEPAAVTVRQTGLVISGPFRMALLACALLLVLQAYKRLGILPPMKALDRALAGLVCLYAGSQFVAWFLTLKFGEGVNLMLAVRGTAALFMIVLLAEAVLLWSAAASLGWGMVAKCWSAFSIAILMMFMGHLAAWGVGIGLLPSTLAPLTWYFWFVSTVASAVGPAYQLEATRRALAAAR